MCEVLSYTYYNKRRVAAYLVYCLHINNNWCCEQGLYAGSQFIAISSKPRLAVWCNLVLTGPTTTASRVRPGTAVKITGTN